MVDGDANIDDEEMVDANIDDENEEMVDANIDDEDEEMVDANIDDEEMVNFEVWDGESVSSDLDEFEGFVWDDENDWEDLGWEVFLWIELQCSMNIFRFIGDHDSLIDVLVLLLKIYMTKSWGFAEDTRALRDGVTGSKRRPVLVKEMVDGDANIDDEEMVEGDANIDDDEEMVGHET
ncbi:hypothetical protein Sjap_022136 [Stephania japonica]|uniref:Uncharacterized protein n=1 Tax=Stephania japonica TaxID=461633 RepID=A0AAP0EX33_9MAGN